MKLPLAGVLLALCGRGALAADADADASPIGKVLQMIGDLQSKVISEGEAAQKEYAEFAEWCEDRARDLSHEIKTGKSEVLALKAAIEDEVALIASNTARIEELASSLSADQADLKAAVELRAKENADFAIAEKDLVETIDTITRAIGVLEKELKKGARSMLQMKNAVSLTQALTVMVQGAAIASSDADKLAAFVQAQNAEDDEDEELTRAPAAAAYESKSSGIIDTLEDLSDKAESALAEARKKETTAAHNFNLLKKSIEDQIAMATKEMEEAKKGIAVSTEKKSTAEGELQVATKELASDIESQKALHHDCLTRAENFEAETKSRGEELAAIAEAKKIIKEATAPPEEAAAGSFLQVRRSTSDRRGHSRFAVVRFVRALSRRQHSASLAQLAVLMADAVRDKNLDDPLAKVKSLITEMITKLEEEGDAEADKKAYCDRELAATNAKKTDKSDRVKSLSTKIDEATARIATLGEEVAKLEKEIGKLVSSQAELDKLRADEKALYEKEKAEQAAALKGVRLALQVLNEYYAKKDTAHKTNSGAAGGIIGLLEVCESDISKQLAELVSEEEASVAEYEEVTKANAIEKATKEKDVEYKTRESKQLTEASAQMTGDRTGVQTELDAVLEYLRKVEEECVAKPEQHEERQKRRQQELDGLKEALNILAGETAFLQRSAVRRTLRGHNSHPSPA